MSGALFPSFQPFLHHRFVSDHAIPSLFSHKAIKPHHERREQREIRRDAAESCEQRVFMVVGEPHQDEAVQMARQQPPSKYGVHSNCQYSNSVDFITEMDDRVKSMLKLIEGDADSFGKRAELYFKSRPELVSFVEEAYRAYRALAERYDHISGELHKANHTIATAFPDQVHHAMLEEEDDNFPKAIAPIDARKIHKPPVDGLISKRKEDRSAIRRTQ